MKTVGIKVLKDNLSKYLRYVREGETIYVTDRDTVIAEMHRPTRPGSGQVSRWDEFLNEAERDGSVQRAQAASGPSLRELCKLDRPVPPVDLIRLIEDVKSD